MRKLLVAAIIWALGFAGPVVAGDEAKRPKDETLLMNPVGLPVVVDGQLVNYVFVTLRLRLSRSADPNKVHALEPVLRDALVRAGGRTPFVRPDNYAAVDDGKVIRTVMAAADAAAGRGAVVQVLVVKEQAQHYSGLPRPAGLKR